MKPVLAGTAQQRAEMARLHARLAVAPRDIEAIVELAVLLEGMGALPAAIDICRRLLADDRALATTFMCLGRIWRELGEGARSRGWFERTLTVDPRCDEAIAQLAIPIKPKPLTTDYVRTLFDTYADSFDENLIGSLSYRAPLLVGQCLAQCGLGMLASRILDIGCGTGLSGLALRPFATTLDGVDLSPNMLAKARERAIYTSLETAEATDFLINARKSWDIIAAIDVLNYIGDLTAIFHLAAERLLSGGRFAGTIETGADSVMLTEKRRYTHSLDHLQAASKAGGFSIEKVLDAPLRMEVGAPIASLTFTLIRSG